MIYNNKSSAVAEMGDRWLATIYGPKRGGCCDPFAGAGTPSSTMWTEVYFRTKRRLHPSIHLATIDMGQKLGGSGCAFFLGVAGPTANTMSRMLRPTSVPSGILIHAAVWPQKSWAGIWVTQPPTPFGVGGWVPIYPHLTQSRLCDTSISSGILMHPAVWPQ